MVFLGWTRQQENDQPNRQITSSNDRELVEQRYFDEMHGGHDPPPPVGCLNQGTAYRCSVVVVDVDADVPAIEMRSRWDVQDAFSNERVRHRHHLGDRQ